MPWSVPHRPLPPIRDARPYRQVDQQALVAEVVAAFNVTEHRSAVGAHLELPEAHANRQPSEAACALCSGQEEGFESGCL